jgi:cation:H+ antiporter
MFLSILAVIAGLVVLILGAESLVRGASSLAAKLRVSALVIGLTVVAFGTSAPELTVSLLSAIQGSADLAVANVVGSNIVNILLILGISAIIIPLSVKSSTVWKEIPFALLGVFLVFTMANDSLFDDLPLNAITRTDGIALLALMAIFMYYIFGIAKSDRDKTADAKVEASLAKDRGGGVKQFGLPASIGLSVLGLAGLVLGGRLLVSGATDIAKAAGLSEALIGLTVIAVGTSLPELATSVVAALRKHADIAIGNVVGSNIFNVFFVLGVSGTVAPLPISSALNFDIIVSIAATLLLLLFVFTGRLKRRLTRWEGVVFVLLYVAYVIYLVARG